MSSTIGSLRSALDCSFQLKLFILCGFFILLAGTVVTIYAISVVQNESIESRGASASDYAAGIANRIMDELDSSLEISRTVAKIFEGVKSNNIPLSRQDAMSILISALSSSPYIYGGGVVWEPNAFDARDAIYEKSMYHDETGRFIPYFYKPQNEVIYVQPATGYTTDAWYLEPQTTKSPVITEPFFINVSGKRELLTTISSPIIIDKTFLGVVMVDVRLEKLQEYADAVKKRHGEGEMLIISNTGLIVAATGRPELRNRPMEKFHSFLSNDIINIDYGTSGYRVRNGYIEVYAPIYVSWTKTPWLVEVFYPTNGIKKETLPVVIRLGIMGLVATILGVMCIWYGVRRLTLPLQMTTIRLAELSSGKTPRKIEAKGNDEMAEIARSFDRLLDQIDTHSYQSNQSNQSYQPSTNQSQKTTYIPAPIPIPTPIPKEHEKVQGMQETLKEVKKYVSDIEQAITTLSTSERSIPHATPPPESSPPKAYKKLNTETYEGRIQNQTEYNARMKQTADEIVRDVHEIQDILHLMKDECEDEDLSLHIRVGCEELEKRLTVILHMIQKLRREEGVFKYDDLNEYNK